MSLVNELCSMYYAGDGLQIVNTFSRLAITGNNKAFVFGVRLLRKCVVSLVNELEHLGQLSENAFLVTLDKALWSGVLEI